MDLQITFEKTLKLARALEVVPNHKSTKDKLIECVGDIVEYTFTHCDDKPMLDVIMRFLVELFFDIGGINADVDDILDVLTRARIIVRQCHDSYDD
jgi:hypothetical protein